MTLEIRVSVPESVVAEKRAPEYLADAMAAIGFARGVSLPMPEKTTPSQSTGCREAAEAAEAQSRTPAVYDSSADKAPQRERGKPAPGKTRRTKAEIEEDEAADAADQAAAEAGEKPAISTGEARVDPANPEEEAQDAADEAADEANQSGPEATREDVRAVMVEYSKKKGLPALNADMTAILKEQFPDGAVTKLSEIPEDPEAFSAVIAALTAKLEG